MLAVLKQAPAEVAEGCFSVRKEVKYLCGPTDSLFIELRVTALGA